MKRFLLIVIVSFFAFLLYAEEMVTFEYDLSHDDYNMKELFHLDPVPLLADEQFNFSGSLKDDGLMIEVQHESESSGNFSFIRRFTREFQ